MSQTNSPITGIDVLQSVIQHHTESANYYSQLFQKKPKAKHRSTLQELAQYHIAAKLNYQAQLEAVKAKAINKGSD